MEIKMKKFFKTTILTLSLIMSPKLLNAGIMQELLKDNSGVKNNHKVFEKTTYVKLKDIADKIQNIINKKDGCYSDEEIPELSKCIDQVSLDESFVDPANSLKYVALRNILEIISNGIIKNDLLSENNLKAPLYSKRKSDLLNILDLWLNKLVSSNCERDIEMYPNCFYNCITDMSGKLQRINSTHYDRFKDIQIDLLEKCINNSKGIKYYIELLSRYANIYNDMENISNNNTKKQYLKNAIERLFIAIAGKYQLLARNCEIQKLKEIYFECQNILADNIYSKISDKNMQTYFDEFWKDFTCGFFNNILDRYKILVGEIFEDVDLSNLGMKNNYIRSCSKKFFELDSSLNEFFNDDKFNSLECAEDIKSYYEKIRMNFVERYEDLCDFDDLNKMTFLSIVKSYGDKSFDAEPFSLPPVGITEEAVTDYCKKIFPGDFKYSVDKFRDYFNKLLGNTTDAPKSAKDVLSILEYDKEYFSENFNGDAYVAYLNTAILALNQVGGELCSKVILLFMNDLYHVTEFHFARYCEELQVARDFNLTYANYSDWINLFITTGNIELANVAAECFIKHCNGAKFSTESINQRVAEYMGKPIDWIEIITEYFLRNGLNDNNYKNYIYEQTTRLADNFSVMNSLIDHSKNNTAKDNSNDLD